MVVHSAIRIMGKNAIPPIIRLSLCSFVFVGENCFLSDAFSRMFGMINNPNKAEMNNGMILMSKPKFMFMMYDARNGNYDAKIGTNNLLGKFSDEKMIFIKRNAIYPSGRP